MEDENQIPKPQKRKRKVADKNINLSKGLSSMSKDQIKEMLSKVIMKDMMDREYNEVKDVELDSLVAMNQEFLKCFMIVGYDLNEVPVVIFQANSQLQADAISSAVTKIVISGGKSGGIG